MKHRKTNPPPTGIQNGMRATCASRLQTQSAALTLGVATSWVAACLSQGKGLSYSNYSLHNLYPKHPHCLGFPTDTPSLFPRTRAPPFPIAPFP